MVTLGRWGILLLVRVATAALASPPNILIIVADDYGWNDVGFHGSELDTPNIDELAASGVILDQYYVLPVCTPTRSALLASRFPIKTGLQVSTISPAKPYGLHLNYSTLADELKARNYQTHALGKWHLGYCREEFMPHRRGHISFTGYVNGAEHYFTHIRDPNRVNFTNFSSGFDFYDARADDPRGVHSLAWAQNATGPSNNVDPTQGNCYSAHYLSAKAESIVDAHSMDATAPLYMYLAFQSVHSPDEAPQSYIDQYAWMTNTSGYTPVNRGRPVYGGMVAALDEAVGNVTAAFKRKGGDLAFWNNTLVVFTTDNGGIQSGNNYPLRGRKATLWEGGTRGVAFVRGAGLEAVANTTNSAMMHVVDWLPTLLAVAGPKANKTQSADGLTLDGIDGLDMWKVLSSPNGTIPSPRTEFVYNIEPVPNGVGVKGMNCGAVRLGCHKLIKGDPGSGTYDPKPQPRPTNGGEVARTAAAAHAVRAGPSDSFAGPEQDAGPWLFDLCVDPTESTNLFNDPKVASVQAKLEDRLESYHRQMVPALYNVYSDDYLMDPSLNNGTWTFVGCAAE